MKGNTFIEGTNPDFGHISQIHSHRAEVNEIKGEIFLVLNKVKGRVLKMEEIQQVGFRKLGADKIENNDDNDKIQSDK